MAKKATQLTAEQQDLLNDHTRSTMRPYNEDFAVLERLDLITITQGRFGKFSKLTDAGRQYLEKNTAREATTRRSL